MASGKTNVPSFQSTHPMRGATSRAPIPRRRNQFQSTHPMRGATNRRGHLQHDWGHFNPRTPCGVRRAFGGVETITAYNFNPRTPCGVRPAKRARHFARQDFNPRTPCGVRRVVYRRRDSNIGFQSTHPMRGATMHIIACAFSDVISIHAPHAGCDRRNGRELSPREHFNPRTPCGVRRIVGGRVGMVLHFNPRTPCGVRPQI